MRGRLAYTGTQASVDAGYGPEKGFQCTGARSRMQYTSDVVTPYKHKTSKETCATNMHCFEGNIFNKGEMSKEWFSWKILNQQKATPFLGIITKAHILKLQHFLTY